MDKIGLLGIIGLNSSGLSIDDIATMNYPTTIRGDATKISAYAFYNTPIKGAYFPKTTSIGNYAFYSCKQLTSVDFPNAAGIGGYTFNACSELTSINLPNVTSIGNYAFYGCTKLTNVDFPNVTSLGGNTFATCNQLTSANFPNVTSIGSSVFLSASMLEKVDLRNYQGSTNATTSSTLRECFSECRNLKYIAFQNLTNGFRQASTSYSPFAGYSFKDVDSCYMIMDMETPPTLSSLNAFQSLSIRNKIVVCVPESSLADWQNATNWASMNIQSIESLETELKGQFDWLDAKYWGN